MAERRDRRKSRAASSEGGNRAKNAGEVSAWEWVVAGVSALLVVAVIATLLYQQVGTPDTPPQVAVAPERIVDVEGGYLVEFVARNQGNATAADVEIEGRLESGDGRVETSTVTLDFVPANAIRRGGLYFEGDPRAGRLSLDANGYREP